MNLVHDRVLLIHSLFNIHFEIEKQMIKKNYSPELQNEIRHKIEFSYEGLSKPTVILTYNRIVTHIINYIWLYGKIRFESKLK